MEYLEDFSPEDILPAGGWFAKLPNFALAKEPQPWGPVWNWHGKTTIQNVPTKIEIGSRSFKHRIQSDVTIHIPFREEEIAISEIGDTIYLEYKKLMIKQSLLPAVAFEQGGRESADGRWTNWITIEKDQVRPPLPSIELILKNDFRGDKFSETPMEWPIYRIGDIDIEQMDKDWRTIGDSRFRNWRESLRFFMGLKKLIENAHYVPYSDPYETSAPDIEE